MASFLKVLLYITSILSSLLLIGVIMIQQNKSGGGLGAVSGGVTESMFGTQATNVLTKVTTWLAVIFLASSLLLGSVLGRMDKGNTSVVETLQTSAAPAAPAPAPAAPAEDKPAEEKPAEAAK